MQKFPSQSLLVQTRQMDLSLFQLVLLASVFYAEARNLYLLEGHHVTLDIHGHEELKRENIDFVHWYFHKPVVKYYPITEKLVLLNLRPNGTLEFDSRNFSMKLKNLQKNDSGTYRGEIGAGENHFVTEYTLTILDPVSTPHLIVESNRSGSEFCNATMTCTGHDVSVTFLCNGRTCTHIEGASTTDHNLVVIARHNSIFCNYSNQVSWSEAVVELEEVCPFYKGQDEASETSSPWRWTAISFSVGLSAVITLALLTLLILRTWKNEGRTGRDSNYKQVDHSSSQAEAQTLTYSTVSFPSQHILSNGVHHPPKIDDFYSLLSPPILAGVVK